MDWPNRRREGLSEHQATHGAMCGKWQAAACRTACRETRLKALLKSSLRRTLLRLCRLRWTQARTVCTAISAPAFTPTPTWEGQRRRRASGCTMWAKHFAVRRRSTSPMAMGLTPPCGLGTATRLAPARTGATAPHACPGQGR